MPPAIPAAEAAPIICQAPSWLLPAEADCWASHKCKPDPLLRLRLCSWHGREHTRLAEGVLEGLVCAETGHRVGHLPEDTGRQARVEAEEACSKRKADEASGRRQSAGRWLCGGRCEFGSTYRRSGGCA